MNPIKLINVGNTGSGETLSITRGSESLREDQRLQLERSAASKTETSSPKNKDVIK